MAMLIRAATIEKIIKIIAALIAPRLIISLGRNFGTESVPAIKIAFIGRNVAIRFKRSAIVRTIAAKALCKTLLGLVCKPLKPSPVLDSALIRNFTLTAIGYGVV
jgi:hypothetical protein